MAEIYTISMTGFFACSRGGELANESSRARFGQRAHRRLARREPQPSWSLRPGVSFIAVVVIFLSPPFLQHHHQMLGHRTQRQRREHRERADEQHHQNQQEHEHRVAGGQRAGARRRLRRMPGCRPARMPPRWG